CDLRGTNLTNADLSSTVLVGAIIDGSTTLRGAILQGGEFEGIVLN
ncbi:MAG: pentapeptide repeat-containing protein, partial [Proteobacteria bacterium]